MSKGTVFKKCGCRIPVLDPDGHPVLAADGSPKLRRAGASCPKLRREAGGWSANHGSWHFQIEVTVPGAGRQIIAKGGYTEKSAAEQAVEAIGPAQNR